MSGSDTNRWPQFLKIAILTVSLVLAVTIFTCGAAIFWSEFWQVPQLVYTVLPTYVIKDQNVNGLVVENRGKEAAHKVLIRVVELDEPIETFTIKTNEAITDQQADERNITVWLERVVPGSSVTLYIPTNQALPLEDYLSVTSEEGRAVPASSQEELSSLLALGLAGVIILFLMIIGGVMGWVLARMSTKN